MRVSLTPRVSLHWGAHATRVARVAADNRARGHNEDMRILGNLIWLVFAGVWLAFGYILAGLIMCVLIITIPFGLQAFKLAAFSLWPFGRTVVQRSDAGVASGIGNVIWFVLAGWWMALGHLITSIPLFLSIIGIPLGLGNLKMIPISLFPFGKAIVDIDQLDAVMAQSAVIIRQPAPPSLPSGSAD